MINYHDVVNCSGKEYLVIKCNPKKVRAIDLVTGKTWNIPYYMATFVRKATSQDLSKHIQATAAALVLGQVVSFNSYPKEAGKAFVVIGVTATGVKIARLGGDSDKFYRGVQPSALDTVPTNKIAMFL